MGFAARTKGAWRALRRKVSNGFARIKAFTFDGSIFGYDPAKRGRKSSRRSVDQWIAVYASNSRLRGPIDRRARDVAQVKLHLYRHGENRGDPFDREEIFDHEILDTLKRPNHWMTYRQWVSLGFVYLELAGRWVCWIERDKNGRPWKLWPIRPQDLQSTPKPGDPLWRFLLRGKQVKCLPTEVFFWFYLDPDDPYGTGLGRAPAVGDEVAQDGFSSRWNSHFFRQGANFGKIVAVPGLNEKSGPAIRADWEKNHAGLENAHRPFFVSPTGPGEVTVTDMSKGHKDLDFVDGKKYLRDTIRQNFSVPGELTGNVENSNRATVDAAINIHQRLNVAPDVESFVEQLNIQIVSCWGDDDLYLEAENPIQETQEFTLNQTTKGLLAGTVEVNEWRIKNGFRPSPGWDIHLVPVNMSAVRSGDVDELLKRLAAPSLPDPASALPKPPTPAPNETSSTEAAEDKLFKLMRRLMS